MDNGRLEVRQYLPAVEHDQGIGNPPPPPGASPNRLLLTLPASKTDPFRQGITLPIAAAGDTACAVTALHHLISRWPEEPHTPLFSNTPFNTTVAGYSLSLPNFDPNWVVAKL